MKKYRIRLFTSSSRHIENPFVRKVEGGQECFCLALDGKIDEYININEAHEVANTFVSGTGNSFERATVEEVP